MMTIQERLRAEKDVSVVCWCSAHRSVHKKDTEGERRKYFDGLKPFVIFQEKGVSFFQLSCCISFFIPPKGKVLLFLCSQNFRYYIVILLNWSNYYSFAFSALFHAINILFPISAIYRTGPPSYPHPFRWTERP